MRDIQFEIKKHKFIVVGLQGSSLLKLLFEVNGHLFSVASKAGQSTRPSFTCLITWASDAIWQDPWYPAWSEAAALEAYTSEQWSLSSSLNLWSCLVSDRKAIPELQSRGPWQFSKQISERASLWHKTKWKLPLLTPSKDSWEIRHSSPGAGLLLGLQEL